MRRPLATLVAFPALAAVLISCGTEGSDPSQQTSTSTPSSSPSSGVEVGHAHEGGPGPKSYDDPLQLREAYTGAGALCVGGTIIERDEDGQSVQCQTTGGDVRIDVYDSPGFVDNAVAYRLQQERPVLAGPNWAITGDGVEEDLRVAQKELGGTLYIPGADQ